VEGLEVVSPNFADVIPLTLVVLFALFLVQKHGTAGIGRFFGPVMLLWFAVIAALGVLQIARNPASCGPCRRTTRWPSRPSTRASPSSPWARWCCA
jgi:hypothetical protein